MFEMESFLGNAIDQDYADKRMRNEPLVEITQVKGTSDTHPLLSPDDNWADFEIMDVRVGSRPPTYSKPSGGYIREAYFCLLYTSPSPRDGLLSRMPSSA